MGWRRESNHSSGTPADPVHYRRVLFCKAFPSHRFPIVPRDPTASDPSVTKCDTPGMLVSNLTRAFGKYSAALV